MRPIHVQPKMLKVERMLMGIDCNEADSARLSQAAAPSPQASDFRSGSRLR
jgi:hypothetical protein